MTVPRRKPGPFSRPVLEATAADYGLTLEQLLDSAGYAAVYRRYDAMTRLRALRDIDGRPRFSWPQIGALFGTDHTMAIHGARRWAELVAAGAEPGQWCSAVQRRRWQVIIEQRRVVEAARKAADPAAVVRPRFTAEEEARLKIAYLRPGASAKSAGLEVGISTQRAEARIALRKWSALLPPEEKKARHRTASQRGIAAAHAARIRKGELFWRPLMDRHLVLHFVTYGEDVADIAPRMGITAHQAHHRLTALGISVGQTPEQKRHRRSRRSKKAAQARNDRLALDGQFAWSRANCALLKRLYVDEDQPMSACALRIGCTVRQGTARAMARGYTAMRVAKGVRRKVRPYRLDPAVRDQLYPHNKKTALERVSA